MFWAGACFGFGAAIKIWAAVPALVAWVLCLLARRAQLRFPAGFVAGIAVPCVPFLILAPSGFGRTVFLSELVQATHGRVGANPRVADITGVAGLSSIGVEPHIWAGLIAVGALVLLVAAAWLRDPRAGSALDWFALIATVVVTGMLFSPSEWYEHYAAFAAPFLVVLVGLSAARLFAPRKAGPDRRWIRASAAVIATLAVAAMAAGDAYGITQLYPARDLPGASALIPAGACVLTDTASVTIVINRFSSSAPGCPALVDAVGTLISTTDGKDFAAGPARPGRRHARLAGGLRARRVRLADRQQRVHRRADRLDTRPARVLHQPFQAHRPAQFLPRARGRPARRDLRQDLAGSGPLTEVSAPRGSRNQSPRPGVWKRDTVS